MNNWDIIVAASAGLVLLYFAAKAVVATDRRMNAWVEELKNLPGEDKP